MGNISALVLALLSFYVPYWYGPIRRDKSALIACWFVLAVRHGLAVMNAFVTPLSTSWGDLYRFHNIGAGLSDEAQPYGTWLKIVYKLLGTSFWLGEVVSVLVGALSLILFVRIAQRLSVAQNLVAGILCYGLMLSPAIHCSVTLREPYQSFAFMGMVSSLIELRIRPGKRDWLLFGFSCFGLIFMHQGMAVFVAGVVCLGLPWAVQGAGRIGWLVAFFCLALGPFVGPRIVESFSEQSATAAAFTRGNLMEYAVGYRENIERARSDYGLSIDKTDIFAFVNTSLAVVVMYYVAPLPWQVTSPMDYYAFFENWVRIFLILGAIHMLPRQRPEVQARVLFCLGMALALETIWAMGTSNWGTALRHHTVAWPIFVLIGIEANPLPSLDPEWTQLQRRRARRKAALAL